MRCACVDAAQVIQAAIKDRTPSVQLLGKTIDVNFNAGIFVTMNPAGKAYGGRSKLPDNLKQLFRPVAMDVPDNELIAEVMLYSEGFTGAKDLASKMVALFVLSRQLLSQQQHYDWGLRAMKTCLNTVGSTRVAVRALMSMSFVSPGCRSLALVRCRVASWCRS